MEGSCTQSIIRTKKNFYLRWLWRCLPLEQTGGGMSPRWYGVLKEDLIHKITEKGGKVAQRHLSSYDIPFLRHLCLRQTVKHYWWLCNRVLWGFFFFFLLIGVTVKGRNGVMEKGTKNPKMLKLIKKGGKNPELLLGTCGHFAYFAGEEKNKQDIQASRNFQM